MNQETKRYIKFMWSKHPGRIFVASLLAIPLLFTMWQIVFAIWPTTENTGVLAWTVMFFLFILTIALLFIMTISAISAFVNFTEEN